MVAAHSYYEFGPFRVDPNHRMLWRNGEVVAIPPKPFGLLLLFIEHRGEALSKDRLIEMLWSGTVGTEANLSVNIATLRKILGEKPRDHRYIVTIPQQGYSFVADVRVSDGAAPSDPELAPHPVIRQIAVLPFRSVGFAAGSDYLGLGLSDAITSGLTSLRHIAVRATSSTQRSAGEHPHDVRAGQRLGVDAVVEGTIRKVAGSLDVMAALVRVVDSTILWQQSFNASAPTLPLVGQTIAEAVRAFFETASTPPPTRRLTENADAFRAYVQGRHLQLSLEPNSFEKSISLFQQAIAIDPAFALAHIGVARSYHGLWWLGVHSEKPWASMIETAARHALDLDPTLAEAHVYLGLAALEGRCRFEAARVRFERALSLAPMSSFAELSYALYFLATADVDEALRRSRRALALDPMLVETNVILGFVLLCRREYAEAVRQFQMTMSVDGRFTWATYMLGWCHVLAGDTNAALGIFKRLAVAGGPPWIHAMLAFIHLRSENAAESAKHLAAWEAAATTSPRCFFWCAVVHLGRKETEKAVECLEKALHQGEPVVAFLATDPRWDPLRETPRFQALVQSVIGPRP